jgi:hypothetical protein
MDGGNPVIKKHLWSYLIFRQVRMMPLTFV